MNKGFYGYEFYLIGEKAESFPNICQFFENRVG